MKIPYYPGCTLKTTAKNFETSAIESAKILGVELIELPKWNCCGTVFSMTTDDLMHHLAPIRNLIRVQEMNEKGIVKNEYRVVTLCTMCFNTLKRSNLFVKQDPERLKKINSLMDEEKDYQGNVKVLHFLEILKELGFEQIRKKVKKPLQNLKVVPYYGCLMVRPEDVGIDKPENPTILKELFEALGAEVVDIPFKTRCCGSYQTVNRKELVAELVFDILNQVRMEGGECVGLSCPLCAFNLDNRQDEVKKLHPEFSMVPVFYFTQLMAVAFGLNEKICGFELNHINPKPLLEKKGLLNV
ncbi:heterodisulfide reductase, subunit B [Candidatus Bathyarchaeota archaeon]|nr:MAG: heterodisulfide reductase, subunit B [Candidatus Bathyarchaeota archaeon]